MESVYEYLDGQYEKYNKFMLEEKDYDFDIDLPSKDMDYVKFSIIHKETKKIKISGNCNIIGTYNTEYKIWSWGWAYLHVNISANYTAKKLLLYALNMSTDSINDVIIKSELLNTKLYIDSNIELIKYLAIALYLTKSDWYYINKNNAFNINKNEDENVVNVYFLLTNIKIHND